MKMRKELWFGFSLIAAIVIPLIVLMPWTHLTNGHLGLMMLALICVGIMFGFPTAFTLMGMGVFFAWLSYRSVDPVTADRKVLAYLGCSWCRPSSFARFSPLRPGSSARW